MGQRHIAPPLKYVFFCQCLDNSVVLLIGLAILGAGLSLFSGEVVWNVHGAGSGFWLGVMGLFAFSGVFYRTFFLLLWGRTPGCFIFGLEPALEPRSANTVASFLSECLQVAIPSVWVLDLLLRSLDFRCGLRYSFNYEAFELGRS